MIAPDARRPRVGIDEGMAASFREESAQRGPAAGRRADKRERVISTGERSSLQSVLDNHRVVICLGSGGVGKTTTSAALALAAALRGRRALCLTIDPARRLANSLGLARMVTEEQHIAESVFTENGLGCPGSLSVMMLDAKQTFDRLVARYAPSSEVRDRILDNRIYRHMSSSLAGTQEYMAMEKLDEIRDRKDLDLIVVDTPPTSHAVDFLSAPERLIEAIDSPAMRWFAQAMGRTEDRSFSLEWVGRGAAFLLRGLARFTGAQFLEQVATFVSSMNDLFGGFCQRARRVAATLRSQEVAFLIVTSPNALALEEAFFLNKRLSESEMRAAGVVLNGLHPMLTMPTQPNEVLAKEFEGKLGGRLDALEAVRLSRRALEDERAAAAADRHAIAHLRRGLGDQLPLVSVPAFDSDVHDLGGLSQVAMHLTGQPEPGARP